MLSVSCKHESSPEIYHFAVECAHELLALRMCSSVVNLSAHECGLFVSATGIQPASIPLL